MKTRYVIGVVIIIILAVAFAYQQLFTPYSYSAIYFSPPSDDLELGGKVINLELAFGQGTNLELSQGDSLKIDGSYASILEIKEESLRVLFAAEEKVINRGEAEDLGSAKLIFNSAKEGKASVSVIGI